MEKYPISNPRMVTRRNVLAGMGAATVGAMMPTMTGNGESKDYADTVVNSTEQDAKENFEQYNELSESGYFLYDVGRFSKEFYNEAPLVLENMDIYSAIQDNFSLPKIHHETLRKNLEALAPAIGFAESRYKDAMSEVGAFGVMQLMPGTWEELSKENDNEDDLVSQVKVAARLMEQAYRHVMGSCKEELAQIEQAFFNGDSEACETQFLTPLFINCYNAGMGSMVTLVQEFVKLCPTPADTVELFEQSEMLTGYDVFIGMAHTGNLRGWADWYKDVAANYTCKVYGAHTAVAQYFKAQQTQNG